MSDIQKDKADQEGKENKCQDAILLHGTHEVYQGKQGKYDQKPADITGGSTEGFLCK